MKQLDLPSSFITDAGQKAAASVLGHVVRNKPDDAVVPVDQITFEPDLTVTYPLEGQEVNHQVHHHALYLATSYLKIPWKFLYGLLIDERGQGSWGRELAATNLNTLLRNRRRGHKHLLRSVNGTVLGFMTDRYRLMNSEIILDGFADACQEVGAQLYNGYHTDLRVALQAVLPRTWKVAGKEYLAGVMITNSDFRKGPLTVRFLLGRPRGWAISGFEGMRKMHRGRTLTTNSSRNAEILAEDSFGAATEAKKLVYKHLSEDSINTVMAEVQLAGQELINPAEVSGMLENLALSDEDLKKILEKLDEEPTRLDLAAALAWLAEAELGLDRKLDFMEFAGSMVMGRS